ncbi:formamidopyrimidine-DNA glycosylase [Saccharopolyspora lacisalsi]|uniref:Formamidopyrimidine-DNA glycosylase n=1 Tax=Halosaccharopolyspora lacisalsi TaxID=1000566 RepID=A0A839DUR6_9PSEU|nr:DNA-formamidopyrimidine glycosylase family protein [Halosaccharopolyspora lacisalsi]MBA8824793.1 formamidopyrimidine-DNA glycosylase [Halosaccharopolyspora lacisalsi]
MPELPDVEGFRRVVADHAAQQRIEQVRVHDPRVVRRGTASELEELLRGRRMGRPRRFGKWLVLPVVDEADTDESTPCVLVHFGMTGMLVWCRFDEQAHPHDRAVVTFEHGELRYRDMRKLKGLHPLRRESDLATVLGELGPDAAEVSPARFHECLARGRRGIKSALMEQSVLAGLGNLCVDEILWGARVHPRCRTTDLDDARLRDVHASMRSVLRQAVRVERVPDRPSWLTGHRDEPGGRCPRCDDRLERGKIAGRGTVWCPGCQRE